VAYGKDSFYEGEILMQMLFIFINAVIIVGFLILITVLYRGRARKVLVDDITIAYRQYGSGMPLVLIGGYGSTMSVWQRSFVSLLAARYRVIIFDNRGMGQSTLGLKDYTVQQCAQDTKGLLDKLHISSAYVFGYSMGASIAQELVLKYPAMVKKLILGGANALGKGQMKPLVRKSLADLSGSNRALWMRKLKLIFPEKWLKQHTYLMKLHVTFNRHVMKKQIEALENWEGTKNRLKNIKIPTLLLVGQEDIVTPPANALFMAQYIKGAWLAQFEECGHGLIGQEPYKVGHVIKAFLS